MLSRIIFIRVELDDSNLHEPRLVSDTISRLTLKQAKKLLPLPYPQKGAYQECARVSVYTLHIWSTVRRCSTPGAHLNLLSLFVS